MITIHKFQFGISSNVCIEMPENSVIVSIQVQDDKPTIWAKVDTSNKKKVRMFYVFSTGHEIKFLDRLPHFHIATIQLNGQVWHIME